jgi:hypothetical protein
LEEILNADLPSGIVRREALAAVLPILSTPKEASEINPLSKKIDPSADLPLEETLIVGPPLEETLIVGPPLEETLIVGPPLEETLIVGPPLEETLIVGPPLEETLIVGLPLAETLTAGPPLEEALIAGPPLEEALIADLPLAAALRAANVLRVVSEADPSHVKAAHPGRSPVFRIMPVKRHPRAAS